MTEQSKQSKELSQKTKIISLLLLGLIILPVFLAPQRPGQVLGVNTVSDNSYSSQSKSPNKGSISDIIPKIQLGETNTQSSSAEAKQGRLGEISSGIHEVKAPVKQTKSKLVIKGQAVWDESAKSAVSTDKFPLGSGIKLRYKDKEVSMVVGDARLLSSTTVVVLDKESFVKLGGNPDSQTSIPVTVLED